MPRIRLRPLRNSWGTAQSDTGQIELHKSLKDIPVPSKAFVLNHEKAHLLIDKRKIEVKDKELFCDLVALSRCKINELTTLETMLKKYLIKEYGNLNIKNILKILEARN